MGDNIKLAVAGGCAKCGHPDIDVPDDFEDETEITCQKCGHSAPHLVFFKAGEE